MRQSARRSAGAIGWIVFVTLCVYFSLFGGITHGTVLANGTLTPTTWIYLPYVSKQAPLVPTATETPTPTTTSTLSPSATSTPTSTPLPSATPTTTSSPQIVAILSSSTYTSSSSRHIVGEVRNDTLSNVRYVKVIVSMYDGNNVFVGTDYAYTLMDILTPAQRSPFRVLISDPPASFHHYTLKIEWSATTTQPLQGLVIVGSGDLPASIENWHYVYGEVRNATGGAANYIKIVVTGYDALGTVVMVDYGYTSQTQLANGETGPFEVLTFAWNNPTRYELKVQGSPTTTSQSPAIVILSSSTYTSSSSRYIVGEVRNDALSNVDYVKVIVSMYDSNNVFIGTDYGYTLMNMLTPAQRSPFRVLISDPPANFHHYTLKVEGSITTTQPLQGLVIASSGDRPASIENWHYVYGEVRNDSGGSAKYIQIVATGYDAQGTVIMADYGYTSQAELAADEIGPFEMLITAWNSPVRYELQVQGSRP
jgi:hypothetical protein